jgi:hypothetical protein
MVFKVRKLLIALNLLMCLIGIVVIGLIIESLPNRITRFSIEPEDVWFSVTFLLIMACMLFVCSSSAFYIGGGRLKLFASSNLILANYLALILFFPLILLGLFGTGHTHEEGLFFLLPMLIFALNVIYLRWSKGHSQ